MRKSTLGWAFGGFCATACGAMLFVAPIPQDPAYHGFADCRTLLGVPHFWNVLSNLPFLVVGIWGLARLVMGRLSGSAVHYGIFFFGVALTAFGSSYYHWSPSNDTLLWDRLPMTIAFMAFFAAIIGEHFNDKAGKALLWPLLAVGLFSVVYWHRTESAGAGDLRLYALVQFLPILVIPLALWLAPSRFDTVRPMWWMIGWYAVSKILEAADGQIFALGGVMSGHALKHVAAALAPWALLRGLEKRRLAKS